MEQQNRILYKTTIREKTWYCVGKAQLPETGKQSGQQCFKSLVIHVPSNILHNILKILSNNHLIFDQQSLDVKNEIQIFIIQHPLLECFSMYSLLSIHSYLSSGQNAKSLTTRGSKTKQTYGSWKEPGVVLKSRCSGATLPGFSTEPPVGVQKQVCKLFDICIPQLPICKMIIIGPTPQFLVLK